MGGVFFSWVFKALFHCCRGLPAGLVQGTGPPSEDTIALFNFLFLRMSCNQSLDGSFPPSPSEDRGSQRLSWSSLLHKLTELKGHNQRVTEDQYCRSESGKCHLIELTLFKNICIFSDCLNAFWKEKQRTRENEVLKYKENMLFSLSSTLFND